MFIRILIVFAVTIPICSISSVSQTSPPTAGTETAPAKPSTTDIAALQKQADAGDASAQFALGQAYETGNGVGTSAGKAIAWYRKAAEQGNVQAQNRLGVMYWMGNGVDQDKVKAIEWYRKAARLGDSTAMFNLGAAYYNGEGVGTVNDTLAYAWFHLSSEAGNASGQEAASRLASERPAWAWKDACFAIGELYEKGEDMSKDLDRASTWYRKAAEKGHTQAEVHLAALALNAKNYSETRHWCELAAKDGDQGAYFCLGHLYQHGLGIEQNSKKALEWYEAGARLGHPASVLALARMIANGEGTKQDRPEAFLRLLKIAARGNQDAFVSAKNIRVLMTDKEWEQTQKRLKGRGFDPKAVEEAFAVNTVPQP